jgi:hypothetical protein
MIVQGQVGVQSVSDGALANAALGRNAEPLVSEWQGRYYSQTYRGLVFSLYSGGITIASTHASPLAAGTGTPIIGLWNPQNSGRNLVILKHGIASVSGTPGGGFVWNYATNQTITQAVSGVIVSNFLGGAAASVVKPFTNAATTGSTVGIAFRLAGYGAAVTAAGSVGANTPIMEEDAGDIIVPQGAYVALAAYAVGTTNVVNAAITWAETVA